MRGKKSSKKEKLLTIWNEFPKEFEYDSKYLHLRCIMCNLKLVSFNRSDVLRHLSTRIHLQNKIIKNSKKRSLLIIKKIGQMD